MTFSLWVLSVCGAAVVASGAVLPRAELTSMIKIDGFGKEFETRARGTSD